jgi:aryl-alcohol dehydrogenase-like predicted oxidoreductase
VSSVIAGATHPEQVSANVEAGACALTPEELIEIETLMCANGASTSSRASGRATRALIH